jgi:hypothetical protein
MREASTIVLTIIFLVAGCVTAAKRDVYPGKSADWVLAARYEEGSESIFVDASSVLVDGEIRHAWLKWVYPPRAQPAQSYIIYGAEFNCSDGTNRDDAEIIFYNDGGSYTADIAEDFEKRVLRNLKAGVSSGEPWLALPAGTAWSDSMHFVCEWKPKPKYFRTHAAA